MSTLKLQEHHLYSLETFVKWDNGLYPITKIAEENDELILKFVDSNNHLVELWVSKEALEYAQVAGEGAWEVNESHGFKVQLHFYSRVLSSSFKYYEKKVA